MNVSRTVFNNSLNVTQPSLISQALDNRRTQVQMFFHPLSTTQMLLFNCIDRKMSPEITHYRKKTTYVSKCSTIQSMLDHARQRHRIIREFVSRRQIGTALSPNWSQPTQSLINLKLCQMASTSRRMDRSVISDGSLI